MNSQRHGPYTVLTLIGSGGAAEVYAARGPDGPVALKICRSREQRARQRFRREIAALRQLRHIGLVNIIDADEGGDPPWYAMEDLGRVSLRDLLSSEPSERDLSSWVQGLALGEIPPRADHQARQPLPQAVALALTIQIGEAMGHAHSRGLVHRDLKPENVMLRDNGQPVVIDPGLVVDEANDQRLTASGDALGTLAYMAPEQMPQFAGGSGNTKVPEERADIFALGQMLFEMLGGTPQPLVFRRARAQRRSALAIQPRPLRRIIRCATDLDPAWRYPSMAAVIADLRRFQAGERVMVQSRPPMQYIWRSVRRHPQLSGGGLALFGMLLALVFSLWLMEYRQRLTWRPSLDLIAQFGRDEVAAEGALWYRQGAALATDGRQWLKSRRMYSDQIDMEVDWEWALDGDDERAGPRLALGILPGQEPGWSLGWDAGRILTLRRHGQLWWFSSISEIGNRGVLRWMIDDLGHYIYLNGKLVALLRENPPVPAGAIGLLGGESGLTLVRNWRLRTRTLPNQISTMSMVKAMAAEAELPGGELAEAMLAHATAILEEVQVTRWHAPQALRAAHLQLLQLRLGWAWDAQDDQRLTRALGDAVIMLQHWGDQLEPRERLELTLAMGDLEAYDELLSLVRGSSIEELADWRWFVLRRFGHHQRALLGDVWQALLDRDPEAEVAFRLRDAALIRR